MKIHNGLLAGSLLLAATLNADVIKLYDSFNEPGVTGFTYIKEGTNFGTTWGALITPENPMEGHIAGFRIWSAEYGSYSRADASLRLNANVQDGFRISWKSINQIYSWYESGKHKVALRAANQSVTEDTINSSSANYQNLVEMFTDGTVGGTWARDETGEGLGSAITDEGGGVGPDPIALSPHSFDLVINGSSSNEFSYVLHSTARTLRPLGVDLFIDGQLVTHPETPNGGYLEDKSGFDPALGFGTFSFTTATSGNADIDFVLDEIYFYTGADVNDGTTPQNLWAGYPVDGGGIVDTAPWMDFLNVQEAPWVYSFTWQNWMYIPEDYVTAEGGWVYVPK